MGNGEAYDCVLQLGYKVDGHFDFLGEGDTNLADGALWHRQLKCGKQSEYCNCDCDYFGNIERALGEYAL